jgi:hypothetical protein
MRTGPCAAVAQRKPDRAQAERGIRGLHDVVLQRGGQLVVADIQGADGHRPPAHGLDDLAQDLVLLVLGRQVGAVHIEEFGAQQADPGGAGLDRVLDLARQFEIGEQPDAPAVGRHRRQVAQAGELPVLARDLGAAALIFLHPLAPRADHHLAGMAVDDDAVSAPHLGQQIGDAEDRRDLQRTRHDRRVALGAAQRGRETADPLGIEQGRVGGRQFLGDHDGAFGQMLEGFVGRLRQVA